MVLFSFSCSERIAIGPALFGHVDIEPFGGPVCRFNGAKRLGDDQRYSKDGQYHWCVYLPNRMFSSCRVKATAIFEPFFFLFKAKLGPALCLLMVSFTGCDRLSTLVLLVMAVGLQGAVFR